MNNLLKTLAANLVPKFHAVAPAISAAPCDFAPRMNWRAQFEVSPALLGGLRALVSGARAGFDALRVDDSRSLHDEHNRHLDASMSHLMATTKII